MEEAHKFSSHLPSLLSLPFRFFTAAADKFLAKEGDWRGEKRGCMEGGRRSMRAGYHPS